MKPYLSAMCRADGRVSHNGAWCRLDLPRAEAGGGFVDGRGVELADVIYWELAEGRLWVSRENRGAELPPGCDGFAADAPGGGGDAEFDEAVFSKFTHKNVCTGETVTESIEPLVAARVLH
jgi:hypothetical protein